MLPSLKHFANTVLRSYAILLFSQDRWFGLLLLLVTLLHPVAGACGLAAVIAAFAMATMTGMRREDVSIGLYGFNALLVGIGMGTFFDISWAFVAVLLLAVLVSVMSSAVLNAWLGKMGLPFLSLPFLIAFWLVLLSAREFSQIGLAHKTVLIAPDGSWLSNIVLYFEQLAWPDPVASFFKSLSALFFQEGILPGLLMTVGLLIFSRIAFSLALIGFAAAYFFNRLTGVHDSYLSYYDLGVNYTLTAVAVGGFFVIPSARSYLWAIWCVPVCALLVIGLGKVFAVLLLPVYSLPFCIMVIIFVRFMQQRTSSKSNLRLALVQHYSPEINLYYYLSSRERSREQEYFRLQLPFIGEWTVSQGYDGGITHNGDWSKALDFVITDSEKKTYSGAGVVCDDFYCYNKPVLAPAPGIVEELIDGVEDNAIGSVNTAQNWGNTIIIKHLPGLYTKLSHLKKNSFRVKKGDYISTGDILALCGNSGRSPEPHLHFQAQSSGYVDARTLEYPLAYYLLRKGTAQRLEAYTVPKENETVCSLAPELELSEAFRFQPGYTARYRWDDGRTKREETWEVFVSAENLSYLHSRETGAVAYFVNNGSAFYFTAFYGSEHSLLRHFYNSCYRVVLASLPSLSITDQFPLHTIQVGPVAWLQDFAAPFYRFCKREYRLHYSIEDALTSSGGVKLHAQVRQKLFSRESEQFHATIRIAHARVDSFTLFFPNYTLDAQCISEN